MYGKKGKQLDFLVDRLTNSIVNTISGDSFRTEVLNLTFEDIPSLKKKNGWNFNWKSELNDNSKEVYKLTILNNPQIIQGVISLSIEKDHVLCIC